MGKTHTSIGADKNINGAATSKGARSAKGTRNIKTAASTKSAGNANTAGRAKSTGTAKTAGNTKTTGHVKNPITPKYGVMICGHGSRSASAVTEFAVLAKKLGPMFKEWPVDYGYLEFATPVIRTGLDNLVAQGVTHVLAVPGMLFAAGHAKNDIPSVLNAYAKEKGVTISYGRELGIDPRMLDAAAQRITEAVKRADKAGGTVAPADTCLVVIGRGASDPDANSNVSKVARLLWEGMGFGWAETGYSGVTFPLVEPCLEHTTKLGFKRIIVFPYFLFSGILIDRIYGFTDEVAAAHPDIQFVKASYLNDHPGVISTFADRVREILDGDNNMNCGMCKYRTQVLGFEEEVGLAQQSHHHHVEGQGISAPGSNVEDCELCDHFCTGACRLDDNHHHHGHHHHHHGDHAHGGNGHAGHADSDHGHDGHDHDHHHHPYPHADHPLGPESVRNRKASSDGKSSDKKVSGKASGKTSGGKKPAGASNKPRARKTGKQG